MWWARWRWRSGGGSGSASTRSGGAAPGAASSRGTPLDRRVGGLSRPRRPSSTTADYVTLWCMRIQYRTISHWKWSDHPCKTASQSSLYLCNYALKGSEVYLIPTNFSPCRPGQTRCSCRLSGCSPWPFDSESRKSTTGCEAFLLARKGIWWHTQNPSGLDPWTCMSMLRVLPMALLPHTSTPNTHC